MLYDMITMIRKELMEIVLQRGSLRGGLTNILVVLGISGILFPLQNGEKWFSSPLGLASIAWLPLFMSMGSIADAFAGERERHTLETLLATRLSDQAILFGKLASAVVYGVGLAVTGMLIGAVTVNLAHPGAGFYRLDYFLGAVFFSVLVALLVSGIGVLVSLRADSVRQAYQRMSLGFIVLWLPIILAPQFLPESTMLRISQALQGVNGAQATLIAAAALLALDLLFLLIAQSRFQRSRLILD